MVSGHRGVVSGHRGVVSGHRGVVSGHRGLVSGHTPGRAPKPPFRKNGVTKGGFGARSKTLKRNGFSIA